ncbi:MAG TPA: SPFH domain-containing protein [Planctomycetota bacterium]|jgi:hypothetical protein
MAEDVRLSKAGCIAASVVVLLALGVLFLWTCTVKIKANEFGVRTKLTTSGVEEIDHAPGYVLAIPGLHTVRLWDITWTNLKETLQIRGSDQYTTTVDISVLLRIEPGMCHKVAKHYEDEEHVNKYARTLLNKYANEILAQMKTEDFYNPKVRDEKALAAEHAMSEQLKPVGIEVKNLLVRNIIYDPKFEEQLLQKQLAGQTKSLEVAKGKLAGAQTETELIQRKAEAEVKRTDETKRQEIENLTVETDRKINQITQDAKLEAANIIAKSESLKRQKTAEADFLKAKAQAMGTELLSRVYARPGASCYFARQAVENMSIAEVEVNSNTFNPLDSEKLLKALGLELHAQPLPPAGPSSAKPKP